MNFNYLVPNIFYKPISRNIPFQLFSLVFMLIGALFNIFYMQYVFSDYVDRVSNNFFSILIMIMVFWTYLLAWWTKPYQENNDILLNNASTNIDWSEFDLKPYRFPKECEFCHKKKFERSSHCKICEICVVRRDHHCTWLGNCVGFNNTRYFVNFLIWFLIGDFLFISNYIRYFFNDDIAERNDFFKFDWMKYIFFYSYLFLSVMFGSFVSQMLGQILIYIYNDLTFVEKSRNYFIEMYNCCFNNNDVNNEANHYNKGFLFNFYYLIGPSILYFLLPLPIPKKYEINPVFDKLPLPNAFDLYKLYVKNNDNENLKNYEDSINSTDPKTFIEMSIKFYNDKIIK